MWVKITSGREPTIDLESRMRRLYKVWGFRERSSDGREGGREE